MDEEEEAEAEAEAQVTTTKLTTTNKLNIRTSEFTTTLNSFSWSGIHIIKLDSIVLPSASA